MKKIIICIIFLLTFLYGYSQDELELKERVVELEKQVETQKEIIEGYEKLEERISTRIDQSLSLDLEVKEAYKDRFGEIQDDYKTRMTYIWLLITSLIVLTTLITAIPIYDRKVLLSKLNKQEEKLQKQQEKIEKDLEEHEEFDKKLNKALAEVYNLNASKEADIIKNSSPNNFKPHSEGLVENVMQSIECLMKIPDKCQISSALTWLTAPLRVQESNKIKLSEDEVIEIVKSTLRKYPKELEYLQKNTEEILKGNHWKNVEEKEKIIKILGDEC